MSLHLQDYDRHWNNEYLIPSPLDSEIKTPLPLRGEYITLQLSPIAMSKHLGRPGLTSALRKLELKQYLALFLNVGVTPHHIHYDASNSSATVLGTVVDP